MCYVRWLYEGLKTQGMERGDMFRLAYDDL